MRYWMTYRAKDATPNPEKVARIDALSKEMAEKGVLLDSGALLPPSQGAKVNDAGNFTVSSGPYAETNEVIIGYAILEAANRDEAIALAQQFMRCAGDGELELRPIVGGSDAPHH
jgi:hypothetical protein